MVSHGFSLLLIFLLWLLSSVLHILVHTFAFTIELTVLQSCTVHYSHSSLTSTFFVCVLLACSSSLSTTATRTFSKTETVAYLGVSGLNNYKIPLQFSQAFLYLAAHSSFDAPSPSTYHPPIPPRFCVALSQRYFPRPRLLSSPAH